MPPNDILIRDVPVDVRNWLNEEKLRRRLSLKEFVLQLISDASQAGSCGRPPSLFGSIEPQRQTIVPLVPFRFIDLFAGIGGFRIGLTKVGGQCVFTSEWDLNSQKTYHAWYGEDKIYGDINAVKMREIPEHDVLAAGFPCQPFSIAGVSKKNSLGQAHGFKCERQGNLFFKICEIARAKRPPVLFLENVKNLKSHDSGKTWLVIQSELERLRYRVFSSVIDAAHWVPQHRERIMIVGFDRDLFGESPPFEFPYPPPGSPTLADILESNPDPKYTLTDHLWKYLQEYARRHREKGNGFGFGLVGPEDIARTLSARYYKDGSEILIRQAGRNPRRLTPREAARLMGYGEKNAKIFGHPGGFPIVVSDTQAYRQFGNSVVPDVVESVGRQILEVFRWQFARTGTGCLVKGRAEIQTARGAA
jgi:DNA (cytosine-5)-methyltransferase 1